MSYEPNLISRDELITTVANFSEDVTFKASKVDASKKASPADKRRVKHLADFWYSIHVWLTGEVKP